MKKNYQTPEIKIYFYSEKIMNYYSNIGNFGFGDKDDDDREGDDNWDDDWSWTKNADI